MMYFVACILTTARREGFDCAFSNWTCLQDLAGGELGAKAGQLVLPSGYCTALVNIVLPGYYRIAW